MAGSVNNIASFALLAVVTYVGASAAIKIASIYIEKYKRKLKYDDDNDNTDVPKTDIKHALLHSNSILWSVGLGGDTVNKLCDQKSQLKEKRDADVQESTKPVPPPTKNTPAKVSPGDVARKLIDDLIKACCETSNKKAGKEGGFIDGSELSDTPAGNSSSDTLSESSSSDQTCSTLLTSVSSLITCDSDSSSVESVTSTNDEKGAIVVDCERTISGLLSIDKSVGSEAKTCVTGLQKANTTSRADAIETEECNAQLGAGQCEQRTPGNMEPCALQQVSETFAFQSLPAAAVALDSIQENGEMDEETSHNGDSSRSKNGLEYHLQLMAMEEEMQRNEREIADISTGDVTTGDLNESDEVADDAGLATTTGDGIFACSSPVMAPILEEEEEDMESGSFNGQQEAEVDNVNTEAQNANVDIARSALNNISDEAVMTGDKVDDPSNSPSSCDEVDNKADDVDMKCVDCNGTAASSISTQANNLSPHVVVTKADVHADNVDGARVRSFKCATCCSQSLGNNLCVTTCKKSDGNDVTTTQHNESGGQISSSMKENMTIVDQSERSAAEHDDTNLTDLHDKSSELTADSTESLTEERPCTNDLHGTQNSSNHPTNETAQPCGHAPAVFETPRHLAVESDPKEKEGKEQEHGGTSLSESKTAEFPESNTVSSSAGKAECGETEQAENVKGRTKCIEFFGNRPKETTPTACSVSAQVRCIHTGSSNGDKMAVIEDGDTCDLEVFLKTLEGLAIGKTKIYVKISLEHEDPSHRRIKRKTQTFKCVSPMTLNKNIKFPNVRKKVLTQGRLVVAVWSKSSLGSNSLLCKCEVEMGKQMKFFEGKGGVMTFSQKLTNDRKVWNDVTLYLS